MKAIRRIRQDFAIGNSEAAQIIAADMLKYGGSESLAAQWTRLWLANHQSKGNAE